MSIAILCPTRGRKIQYERMVRSANETASSKIILISATNGDDNYVGQHFPSNCPTVFMWNKMAQEAMKKNKVNLFMLASDDMIFSTPSWDKAIIGHYESLENKIHVYALQDSRDLDGTPHPIITREYIEAMGYFLPPIFLHFFVDTWTVQIAKANNCFTHMKDYSLVHDKPSDKGDEFGDETHWRIRRMNWLGRDDEVNKSCKHFLEFEKDRLSKVMAI